MIKLKRKIIGFVSFLILEILTTVLQIHNIVLAFVNGNIAAGLLFTIILIAYILWGWALFTDNQGER